MGRHRQRANEYKWQWIKTAQSFWWKEENSVCERVKEWALKLDEGGASPLKIWRRTFQADLRHRAHTASAAGAMWRGSRSVSEGPRGSRAHFWWVVTGDCTSLVAQTVKAFAYNEEDPGSIPESGRFPWRRKWQPTPVLLPGKSHGWMEEPGRLQSVGSQRVGYNWAT